MGHLVHMDLLQRLFVLGIELVDLGKDVLGVFDLVFVDVDAKHLAPQLHQAPAQMKPELAQSDDADPLLGHALPPPGRRAAPGRKNRYPIIMPCSGHR